MILGISEIMGVHRGCTGGCTGCRFRGSEEANYNSELCSFLVPIFQKQVGDCHEITFCKHLGTRVGAGAGTGADTGTYTKVKICFPRKLPPAKRDKLVYDKT